jgi:hypothetical protein
VAALAMFVAHVGHAHADERVPAKIHLTGRADDLTVSRAADGDLRTSWCQDNADGALLITLVTSVQRAYVVVHFDEAKALEISIPTSAKPIWIFDASPAGFDVDGPLDWIRIDPVPRGKLGVCVQEIEVYPLGPNEEWSPPKKRAVPRTIPTVATNDALDRASDEIRALRLGLEDCDLGAMKAWVRYPLESDGVVYETASDEREACLRGEAQAVAPTIVDLNAALSKMTASGDEITLAIRDHLWRLRWRKGQWWLTGVE